MTSAPSSIKGSGLIGYLRWFVEEHGEDRLLALLSQIPEERRVAFAPEAPRLGLIATGWYDSRTAHLLLDAMTQGLSPAERTEMARRASAYSVQLAVRGLFKLAFQLMGTPERYAKYIQRFWRQLHDTGIRKVDIVSDGVALSFIEDWPGHHPFLCEVTTETMAAIFREMGCVDVEVTRLECVSHGDSRCQAMLRWG